MSNHNSEENAPTVVPGHLVFVILFASLTSLGFFLAGFVFRAIYPSDEYQKLTDVGFSVALGVSVILTSICAIAFLLIRIYKKESVVEPFLATHQQELDFFASKNSTLWIVIASALGLFVELTLIRFQGSLLQLFSIFKNVTLLSCFLGLGIGYAQGSKWRLLTPLVMPLLAFETIFLALLRIAEVNKILLSPASGEIFWGLFEATTFIDKLTSYGLLIFLFIITALIMVPLGQLAARLMERQSKLVAYQWNLLGSLFGILLFSVLSFLWTPPIVWLVVVFLGLIPFLIRRKVIMVANLIAVALSMIVLMIPIGARTFEIYSPYQQIAVTQGDFLRISQNNYWFQNMLDLSESMLRLKPHYHDWADTYNLPYVFAPKPNKVLIIGSGAGNDVAAALRNRAKEVDAVEIDPAIISLGKRFHPEQPYGRSAVTTYADDARSFMHKTQTKYDVVDYGLVGTAGTLSAFSGDIRLDNYVYTTEAFREARQKLKPGGLMVVTMQISDPFRLKFFRMMSAAFDGKIPLAYHKLGGLQDCVFIIGEHVPAAVPIKGFEELSQTYAKSQEKVDMSTDDWPFMFITARVFPFSFFTVFAVLFAISLVLWRSLVPEFQSQFSWTLFFLGAGFMLVETKAITELALVYGSTWFVSAVVIAVVLLFALLANSLIIHGLSPSRRIAFLLLFVSIMIGFVVTYNPFGYFPNAEIERAGLALIMVLPLFFSGFVFSMELKDAQSISTALASNFLGAMLGCALEYNSMYFGYRSLYIVALVVYGLAVLASYLTRRIRL